MKVENEYNQDLSLEELHNFVKKAQEGDKAAYYEVFLRVKPIIYKHGNQILLYKSKDFSFNFEYRKILWEEHLNNLYLEICSCIDKFDFSRKAKFTYFVTVCIRNYFLNYSKKDVKTHKKEESINIIVGEDIEMGDMLTSNEKTMEEMLEAKEQSLGLKKALIKLTFKQKQIIFMIFFENMTMRAAAANLGIHYQTAVKLKKKALDRLAAEISNGA